METDISTRLITIRGKVFNYDPKSTNVIYRFLDHDIEAFKERIVSWVRGWHQSYAQAKLSHRPSQRLEFYALI
ncbi:hypothetical protein H5410_056328 [Solanum commersonii]|uniref:Uncharacterized protein n=1 Tax=Solanum commersonii TaxID=4109 RepID=A0A9J5WKZ8_SOLCO|nr:hypothetical protein H5410_056328 [Solanum commersonii]